MRWLARYCALLATVMAFVDVAESAEMAASGV
jgi:hypothetical protein